MVFRRFDSVLGLFLEYMKNVDGFGKADSIDGAISAAGIVLDQFENTAAEAFKDFRVRWLASKLSKIQVETNLILHLVRHCFKVIK